MLGHPSANHARASLEEIEAGIRSGKGTPIEYQVNPGMVLYIPEGGIHQVLLICFVALYGQLMCRLVA